MNAKGIKDWLHRIFGFLYGSEETKRVIAENVESTRSLRKTTEEVTNDLAKYRAKLREHLDGN